MDSCQFDVWNGSKPTENQDVKIYDGALVASHAGDTIVLQDSYQTSINKFREGQTIWLGIGLGGIEKAVIDTYDESTRTIVLTAAPVIALVSGNRVGELVFGGVVARVQDENVRTLDNIEYKVTAVDYAKIFDKKIIGDTWANVGSRYIINDFVNTVVNYNSTLDNLSYDLDADIQAEWLEAADGNNPTVDLVDFLEDVSSGVFAWTNTGANQARWTGSPTSKDLSFFTGVANGQPTKGRAMLWGKTSSFANITSLKIRVGSDAANYLEITLALVNSTDWQYLSASLAGGTLVGNPDWTLADYAVVVVNETANGSIRLNGLRINAQDSFTLYNVQDTPNFSDLRSPQLKPTALINLIAKSWEYIWYIDYEHDIHFVPRENDPAPYDITDTSDNFTDLSVEVDVSNLGNRVIVRGGERTSNSRYSQVFEGTGEKREWLMKNKFKDLEVALDNNSTTKAAEATTNATTVKITAHGFAVGDHVVNRSRSNAVRQILTVADADHYTVDSVSGQTSGDTISYFGVSKTVGIEGIADEATVDYVSNSNEKSVRATNLEITYTTGSFLRFEYNERIPIQVQFTDTASANSLKALGLGDGIFDLDPITDRNITDLNTAITLATAKVNEFSNPVINGDLKTDQQGLKAGQILHVQQITNRALDDNFVIQKITARQREGAFMDYFEYSVSFGTTLFGWIEFMQKLLRTKDAIELNVDDIVETFVTSDEEVTSDDTDATAIGGFKKALGPEIVESDDVGNVVDTTVPWKWEPEVGQPLTTRWNLFEWG